MREREDPDDEIDSDLIEIRRHAETDTVPPFPGRLPPGSERTVDRLNSFFRMELLEKCLQKKRPLGSAPS